MQSFRHISHINDTELSKYLSSKMEHPMHLDRNVAQEGLICVWLKQMVIALKDPKVLLNKGTELISKCRYRNKSHLNWHGNCLMVYV